MSRALVGLRIAPKLGQLAGRLLDRPHPPGKSAAGTRMSPRPVPAAARTCAAVAVACLGVAAAQPTPLVLCLALILLLAITGDLAVAHRLASRADSATT